MSWRVGIDRRQVLRGGLVAGSCAWLGIQADASAAEAELVRDPAGVLDLRRGFDYRTVGRVGRPMADGRPVLPFAGSMACVPGKGRQLVLFLGHAEARSGGAISRVVVDPEAGRAVTSKFLPLTLAGPPELAVVGSDVLAGSTMQPLASSTVFRIRDTDRLRVEVVDVGTLDALERPAAGAALGIDIDRDADGNARISVVAADGREALLGRLAQASDAVAGACVAPGTHGAFLATTRSGMNLLIRGDFAALLAGAESPEAAGSGGCAAASRSSRLGLAAAGAMALGAFRLRVRRR